MKNQEIDHRVRELSVACPRLRKDVRTHFHKFRGKPAYIVEDTASGKFYQLGFPEHQFIQCLDGRTTISVALAENAATQGEDALTEKQADRLIRWLIDYDLLQTDTSHQAGRRRQQWQKKDDDRKKNPLSKLLFFRIPLGCPDRFFASIAPAMGLIFGVLGLVLWTGLVGYGGFELARNWDAFVGATGNVIAPGNWWRIVLLYAVLKLLHECGHGLAIKRYRGEVPEWGIQMLVFITPLAYVDASASWRFPSRWQRIVVSFGGMYVEIAIAALCAIWWAHTEIGTLRTTLHSVIFAASTITVLFNINPLMRFDGYYILVDLLGIPNLGTKGQQFLKWFAKRVFLGMNEQELPLSVKQHPVAIPLYGILAGLWKVVIWIGILTMLSLLAKGAGAALAMFIIGSLVIGSLWKFFRFLLSGPAASGPRLSRALLHLAGVAAIVGASLWLIQIDPVGKGVAVIEYDGKEKVRAGCNGFVEEILVEAGQAVRKGDILLRLTNPDEETAREQLKLEVAESKIRARKYFQQSELSAHQAELENLVALRKKLDEKTSYLESLEVKAPVAGRVVARELESLEGRWISLGSKLLSIIPGDEKELLVSFRQRDIERVTERTSDEIRFRVPGLPRELSGTLTRVETRATRAVPHEVLASSNGGPLPMRTGSDPVSERLRDMVDHRRGSQYDADLDYFSELQEQGNNPQELAKARFAARAVLELPASSEGQFPLFEGQWGYVRLNGVPPQRLGEWLYETGWSYFRKRFEAAEKSG